MAAVSINLATGDNGLLSRAVNSSHRTMIAIEKEAIGAAWNAQMAKHLAMSQEITSDILEEQLIKDGHNVTVEYVDDNSTNDYLITFLDTQHTYTVGRTTGETSEPQESSSLVTNNTVYATLYSDGTLAFDNTSNTIEGKNIEEGTETWNISNKAYRYLNDGFLEVPWYSKREKIITVNFINSIRPISTCSWFNRCENLKQIDNISNLKTKNVTDMSYMFYVCTSLENLDISSFDTKNVTDMSYMFGNCRALEFLNLSGLNTSRVTNMSGMFNYCSSLTSINVSSFDTSNVTDMELMFTYCTSLTSINVSNFNIDNVDSIVYMFSNDSNLRTIYADKTKFANISSIYGFNNLFDSSGTNVFTSSTDGVIFGYDIGKAAGWSRSASSLVRSGRNDRASTVIILHLDPNKKYQLTMSSENYDFGCLDNLSYDAGWVTPGTITIENLEYIVCNFGYQRAHTSTITDAMLEEIKSSFEIKVVE